MSRSCRQLWTSSVGAPLAHRPAAGARRVQWPAPLSALATRAAAGAVPVECRSLDAGHSVRSYETTPSPFELLKEAKERRRTQLDARLTLRRRQAAQFDLLLGPYKPGPHKEHRGSSKASEDPSSEPLGPAERQAEIRAAQIRLLQLQQGVARLKQNLAQPPLSPESEAVKIINEWKFAQQDRILEANKIAKKDTRTAEYPPGGVDVVERRAARRRRIQQNREERRKREAALKAVRDKRSPKAESQAPKPAREAPKRAARELPKSGRGIIKPAAREHPKKGEIPIRLPKSGYGIAIRPNPSREAPKPAARELPKQARELPKPERELLKPRRELPKPGRGITEPAARERPKKALIPIGFSKPGSGIAFRQFSTSARVNKAKALVEPLARIMPATLRILPGPTADAGWALCPPVIVKFDSATYFFNVPEGTSRTLSQRRGPTMGYANDKGAVFLPATHAEAMGGLHGFLMGVADSASKGKRTSLKVVGAPNFKQALAAGRLFNRRNTLSLHVVEAQADEGAAQLLHSDELVKVYGVVLRNASYDFAGAAAAEKKERSSSESSSVRGDSSPGPSKRRKTSPEAHQREARATSPRQAQQPSAFSRADADRFVDAIVKDMYKHVPGAAAFEPPEDEAGASANAGASKSAQLKNSVPDLLPPGLSPANTRAILRAPHLSTRWAGGASPAPADAAQNADAALPPAVLTYILDAATTRGRVDPEKMAAAGLVPGPALGELAAGRSVTVVRPKDWYRLEATKRQFWMKNQRRYAQMKPREKKLSAQDAELLGRLEELELVDQVITPDAVLLPPTPGSVFIQVYVPSLAYLDSLLESTAFDRHRGNKPEAPANTVLHCVAAEVLEDERYQAWMHTFPTETDHVISSPQYCADRLNYPSAALSQLRLGKLDEEIFALPHYGHAPSRSLKGLVLPKHVRALDGDVRMRFVPAAPHWIEDASLDHGLPRFDFPHADMEARERLTEIVSPISANASNATAKQKLESARAKLWPAYVEAAAKVTEEVSKEAKTRSPRLPVYEDIVITALGTGSASPSKYRNVSGTLISGPTFGHILLDAGESTYGQLCRKFGAGIDDVLRNLKLVFVSHSHADHHLGITRLLNARKRLWPRPKHKLFVVTNSGMRTALQEHNQLEALGMGGRDQVTVLVSSALEAGHEIGEEERKLLEAVGLEKIEAVPVQHRGFECYGIVLRHRDGWSISYSGDTMPCAAFAEASKNVTVMIHEATIEDGGEQMAAAKGHSTFGQAIQIARDANAEHCLLTHFSQRYPKLARIGASDGGSGPVIAMAFDLMSVRISDLWKLERYRPAMELLYQADEDAEREREGRDRSGGPGGGGSKQGQGSARMDVDQAGAGATGAASTSGASGGKAPSGSSSRRPAASDENSARALDSSADGDADADARAAADAEEAAALRAHNAVALARVYNRSQSEPPAERDRPLPTKLRYDESGNPVFSPEDVLAAAPERLKPPHDIRKMGSRYYAVFFAGNRAPTKDEIRILIMRAICERLPPERWFPLELLHVEELSPVSCLAYFALTFHDGERFKMVLLTASTLMQPLPSGLQCKQVLMKRRDTTPKRVADIDAQVKLSALPDWIHRGTRWQTWLWGHANVVALAPWPPVQELAAKIRAQRAASTDAQLVRQWRRDQEHLLLLQLELKEQYETLQKLGAEVSTHTLRRLEKDIAKREKAIERSREGSARPAPAANKAERATEAPIAHERAPTRQAPTVRAADRTHLERAHLQQPRMIAAAA